MKIILATLLSVLSMTASGQERFTATVTHVEDGDTVHVQFPSGQKAKIRLWGIDAPETCHKSNDAACNKRPGQPFGDVATKRMAALVEGRQVQLVCNGKQTHSRLVCQVHVGSIDAGLVLVREGQAHHLPKYLGDPDYADAHSSAAKRKIGLWSRPEVVAPEVWRDECWKKGVCPR